MITSADSLKDHNDDAVTLHAVVDRNIEYPTDPHLFCDKPVRPELVRSLLELGPCQPGLKDKFDNFPKDQNGRHFSANWYKRVVESHREIDRHWLVYSPKANIMICFACWLFGNRCDTWSDPKIGCKNFAKGTNKIEKHENSDSHRKAEKELFLTKFRCLTTELLFLVL